MTNGENILRVMIASFIHIPAPIEAVIASQFIEEESCHE